MKNSTTKIMNRFPNLEQYLNSNDRIILSDDVLFSMNNVEQAFLRLAWFFENPDKENFNLETLYKNLDNDSLAFALEVIYNFFANDTYLMQKPNFSIVTEDSEYYNQSQFARFLKENGLTFTRSKLNTYLKRGIVPQPDLTVSDSNFWLKKTCQHYLDENKSKDN